MGAAKARGTFAERRAEAIAAGRVPTEEPTRGVIWSIGELFGSLLERLGPASREVTTEEAYRRRAERRREKAAAAGEVVARDMASSPIGVAPAQPGALVSELDHAKEN